MLERCERCGRPYSTRAVETSPDGDDRCPGCRLPLPHSGVRPALVERAANTGSTRPKPPGAVRSTALHFHHDQQNALKGVVVFAVAVGLLVYEVPATRIEPRLVAYGVLGVLLGGALLLFGLCVWGLIDRSPQLTLDATGITYRVFRSGPRTISWDRIRSIDLVLNKRQGISVKDTLIVYASGPDGRVETIEVGIGALEGGASDVFTKIKSWRIQNECGVPARSPD